MWPQGGVLILGVLLTSTGPQSLCLQPHARASGLTALTRQAASSPALDPTPTLTPLSPRGPCLPLPLPRLSGVGTRRGQMRSEQFLVLWAPRALGPEVAAAPLPSPQTGTWAAGGPPLASSVSTPAASPTGCHAEHQLSAPHMCLHTDSHTGGHMPTAFRLPGTEGQPHPGMTPSSGPRVRVGLQA